MTVNERDENEACGNLTAENLDAYRKCFDDSPLAFCIIDVLKDNTGKVCDFAFVYLNKALADLEGMSKEDLLYKHFYHIFDDTDVKWLDFYGNVAFGGQPNTFDEYSPEIKKYLNIHCYQISLGRCGCLLTDITQKKEMEALLEAQMKYSFAVGAADLAVWEYDIENNRLLVPYGHAGRVAIERYGLSGHVVDDFPASLSQHSNIAADREDLAAMREELIFGKPVVSGCLWYTKNSDKTMRCDKVSYSVTCGADGRPVRAYGVGQDVTAQKKAERHYGKKLAQLWEAGSRALFACTLDLTRDLCLKTGGSSDFLQDKLACGAADELFGKIAALSGGRSLDFLSVFSTVQLISLFENGADEAEAELSLGLPETASRLLAVKAALLLNPSNGSVEALCTIAEPASK